MAVIKRGRVAGLSHGFTSPSSQGGRPFYKNGRALRTKVVLGAVGAACLLVLALQWSFISQLTDQSTQQAIAHTKTIEIHPKSFVHLDLADSEAVGNNSAAGVHNVTAVFDATQCAEPNIWARVEGDALLGIDMARKVKDGEITWQGSFEIPFDGDFRVVLHWYGCSPTINPEEKQVIELHAFHARASKPFHAVDTLYPQREMFPLAVWQSMKRLFPFVQTEQEYVWNKVETPDNPGKILRAADTVVAMDGTIGAKGYYSFPALSNYELVCWVGDKSAEDLWGSFRALRSQIASSQRPFKFHYYSSKSFVHPDAEWDEERKSRFRKCKHVLVSLHEAAENMSWHMYVQQVTTFIRHLTKAFPDDSFPIWLFTTTESPVGTTKCTQGKRPLPRTSNHPCNLALKLMFENQANFPERVRLLDNTDLSLPQLGENKEATRMVIAHRIFVFVGKQVEEWRRSGQVGMISGLKRGDKMEPNFKLMPYEDWDQP